MNRNLKTVLKLGAAVLVGAAVFIGSTTGTSKKNFSSEESSDPKRDRFDSSEGLRSIQGAMMKTSQLITTLISVSESISRLFTVDAVPRYSSSTLIL